MSTPARIVTSPDQLPSDMGASVVAIGNFDGVHRGHRAVLETAMAIAKKENIPAIVLTFEPHPRTFFNPDKPVFRLTPRSLKNELLARFGYDFIFEQAFDAGFCSLSADQFIDELLFEGLKASHIVAGHDFHFAKGRAGTPQYLESRVKGSNRSVDLVEPYCDENGEVISSSRIRTALEVGDLDLANVLLGRPYAIEGRVAHGKKIGRTIGYPTANIELPAEAMLALGIYAVRVHRDNGDVHDGVASFGRRPTFDNGNVLFETFLFDFDGDLYGEELTIELHARLRDELKFDSVEELVTQMDLDSQQAREVLRNVGGHDHK